MPVPIANKTRGLEGGITAALLVMIPLIEPYVTKLQNGTPIQVGIGIVVVGVIAYIKSLASGQPDAAGYGVILDDLESKVVEALRTAKIAHTDAQATALKVNEIIEAGGGAQ